MNIAIAMVSCDSGSHSNNKMAVGEERVVGYDCEFVEDPPKYLQAECPVCLLVLRDPHQVTCCGKSFCKECIERVKAGHKSCPCCGQDSYNDFSNKGLRQPLYGFKVHCSNKEEGCLWQGELGQVDNHLNLNTTTVDNELEGCEYAKLRCSFCLEAITRNQLCRHKRELCNKRPFSCEHCNEYKSTYDDVITHHWPVCGYHPVACPNMCGTSPQRKDLDSHVNRVCPAAVIDCDFSYAGCEVRLPRSEMAAHLKDNQTEHVSLLALEHRNVRADLKRQQEEIKYLRERQQLRKDAEIQKLHQEIESLQRLTKVLSLKTKLFPVDFQVRNPERGTKWTTTPFFTHVGGYKLYLVFDCLVRCVCLLGVGLMKGEYDSRLQWPLTAEVYFQILDSNKSVALEEFVLKIDKQQRVSGKEPCVHHILSSNVTRTSIMYVRVIGVYVY